jgi:hypothetical protein
MTNVLRCFRSEPIPAERCAQAEQPKFALIIPERKTGMNTITSSHETYTQVRSVRTRRGLGFWTVPVLLGLLALLLALAVIGASYEAIIASGDATRYPLPGQLVDVGGYHLHLHCAEHRYIFHFGKMRSTRWRGYRRTAA